MKKRAHSNSARSRIVLIAIMAIVVPTFILSLLGLQLITEHGRLQDDRLVKSWRGLAETKVKDIVEHAEALTRELVRDLPNEMDALKAHLEQIENNSGLVEQAFLLDGSEQLLYPVLEVPAEDPPRPRLLQQEETYLQGLLKQAYEAEYGLVKDMQTALELYMQHEASVRQFYEEGKVGPFELARAIHEAASCLYVMGDYARCIEVYEPLAYLAEFETVSFRLAVLARFHVATAMLKLERRQDGIRELLKLYEFLLTARPPAGQAAAAASFKRRVTLELNELQIEGMGEENTARYEALQQKEASLRQQLEFLRNVRNWWQYQRALFRDDVPPLQVLQQRPEVRTRTSLMSYMFIMPRDQRDYMLLGFKIDLDYVLQEIAESQFREAQFGTSKIAVIDDNNRVVYGSLAENGDDLTTVEVRFPRHYAFWRLRVMDDDAQSAGKLARKVTLVYMGLNLVIVGVIFAGVYLTIKDMNRELELSRMKSDFVSNVSHELKTPLALIRMFGETLQMGRVKEERKQEYYEVITKESERLTALINNVLDFSKIDAGRRTYDMNPSSVSEVLQNTLSAYRYELLREDFEVEVEIDPDLPEIVMDDDALTQALLNLLNNAVKYSRENKYIKVAAKRLGDDIHISVTDHGIGISLEEQSKVFEMFYRGTDESVRSTRGTGLGLAITKHTAEAHGGTMTLHSKFGEGSTFTIILPIKRQQNT